MTRWRKLAEENTVWASSSAGLSLIRNYNITKAPSFTLSSDAFEYDIIKEAWSQVGTVENDGSLVYREVSPPYFDLTTKETKGLVDVTFITDETCTECYNVTVHKAILTNPAGYNLYIREEKFIDIADDEGEELLEKYNITAVPTFILTEGAQYYTMLNAIWPQVGTVEDDGTYVFRNIGVMEVVYRDLTTGEVVGLAQTE